MLKELNENLVPFYAHKVETVLIWCGSDTDNISKLQDSCSYIIDPLSSTPKKTFYAERYGGYGISRNGGGVRCGFTNNYQVKGIGVNPLIGIGTDLRHANGSLGAVHAIYEALWSEVLAKKIPYGAVRTQAVLLTDKYTNIFYERADVLSRRALLVREPVVRPAHFMRAPYFRPLPEHSNMQHDAQRIKKVIRKLLAYLPMPEVGFSQKAIANPQQFCLEGLCELAFRQGRQMAYCRTQFLKLTTSPSNIVMDGRLLDFNGVNSLFPGDYRCDFDYKLRLNEMMKEPAALQDSLTDLCLYLGKYFFNHDFTEVAQQQVLAAFQQSVQEGCNRGYLALLGFSAYTVSLPELPEEMIVFVSFFLKYFERQTSSFLLNSDMGSPLENMLCALVERSRGNSAVQYEYMTHSTFFPELLQKFNGVIYWLEKNKSDKNSCAEYFLLQIELHARYKLCSRKCIEKMYMFEEIATLLDERGDNIVMLKEGIAAIEMKMKALTNAVLP